MRLEPGNSYRFHLCFALGKAFEDPSEYAESWRFYERGNQLKRGESRHQSEIIETNTRNQIEVRTEQFFAARTGVGAPDPALIFVLVGLPRSESTLIEQNPRRPLAGRRYARTLRTPAYRA